MKKPQPTATAESRSEITEILRKVRKIELRFTGSALDFFGWAIYRMSKKTYEKHFAWIFPANEIVCEIEIVK